MDDQLSYGMSDGEEAPEEQREDTGSRLVPARPEAGGGGSFKDGLPWKWIVLGAVGLTVVVGGYWLNRKQEADTLRAQILRTHDDPRIAQVRERYGALRGHVEQWVTTEAARTPTRLVDPRLRVSALGSGAGLYLRVKARDVRDAAGVKRAALGMESDAITRCLGVAPASVRGLYERGGVLDEDFWEQVRHTDDVFGLRVEDEQLRNRMRTDLPALVPLLASQWLLVVIERGDNRRDAPVDVYLWDLRANVQLLAMRTQANGILIPVRVNVPGAPPSPHVTPQLHSGGANDCSIAAQVKEATGEPVVDFGSDVDRVMAPPDAGAGDAAAPDAGAPDAGDAGAPRQAAAHS